MSLLVVKALGLVTVQDLGRPGHMHEALPPGGALVPKMLVRANRAVGNPGGAAGIEICGQLVVRALERNTIALAGGESPDQRASTAARTLEVGEELAIASQGRVAYLAIRGGVDQPVLLGGRGAHLSAGIGSLLRASDRIAVDLAKRTDAPIARSASDARDSVADRETRVLARRDLDAFASGPFDAVNRPTVVRVIVGPDNDAFAPDAFDALVGTTWRISSSSDRVGTRLEGGVLARRPAYEEASRPMVIGAIEVPRDGAPIVLGPEHPTTGGYPIVGVIASDDLDAFHSIPLGGSVRFRV